MTRSLSLAAAMVVSVAATLLACSEADAPSSPTATAPALKQVSAPTLTPQQSGTTNRLQAISPVNGRVAWASGVGGTFVVTTDGGNTWRAGVVPGAEALQFRDVEGISERVAYLMAAGSGTDSRIYKTEDGGATWTLQFQNENPNAFYDCFSFWDQKSAVTFSDAVDGVFPVIRTTDGRDLAEHRRPDARRTGGRGGVRGERHLRGDPGRQTCVDRHRRSGQGAHPGHDRRRGQLDGVRHADHSGHARSPAG